MNALESFISEAGRRIAGVLSIPLAAKMAGAEITLAQSIEMMVLLSIAGFLWVYGLRVFFSKIKE